MGYGQSGLFQPLAERLLTAGTSIKLNSACNPSFTTLQDTQMCGDNNNSGVCVGDEGGPLVVVRNGRYVQVGIIQVMSTNAFDACRTGVKVFTRVTSFLDWIEANMWDIVTRDFIETQ